MLPKVLTAWESRDTGHKVLPGPFLGAIGIGLLIGILGISPAGRAFELQFGLWLLFHLRGAVQPPPEPVIIAMPRDTGERISVPREHSGSDPCADLRVDQTPPTHRTLGDVPERWNRCHHVALLRQLKLIEPAVVVLDVTFRPREDLPAAEDRTLGRTMRDLGSVLLAQRYKLRHSMDAAADDIPVELSPDIAGAALGIAPMPLPQQPLNRFDQFLTFKDSGWAAPTLPALALQACSLDVYPALLSILEAAAPRETAGLPRSADEMTHDGQLQVHMLHLRSVFRALPRPLPGSERLLDAAGARLTDTQRRKLRALFALYTRDNWRYLNFYGPPGSLRTVDIADVLSVRAATSSSDPLRLHDKVVFVGYAGRADWEMLERFPTVFGSGTEKSSGVEIIATAFANLLDRSDPQPGPAWVQFLIAFAAAACIALLCYCVSTPAGTAVTLAAACAFLTLATLLFVRAQLWLPVAMPLFVAAPAGYAGAFAWKLAQFRRDRAALRALLNQSVPREIVDLLARNASQLGRVKETTQVACVMAHVEGFTTLGAALPPARVAELLAEYFAAAFKPIADHGGFISDLKGDSILAVWIDRNGDPAVREKACDACLALQRAVNRFNQAHLDSPLPIRIGVHYGVATLGPIGALTHFEYRAVGDAVQVANRIEQLSKELGTRLLVTAPMLAGLSRFLVRDLGEFALRGRRGTIGILELVSRADSSSPEQMRLCAQFAEARTAIEAGDVQRARAAFHRLSRDFPEDGPSGYFIRRIERET